MDNLYDQHTYYTVIDRINKLSSSSQRQWGKMDIAQMLAHCKVAFGVPLSEKPMPRNFLGYLFGWAIKAKLYNDEPWKKNLPTAPQFRITDTREFEKEKQELTGLISKFYTLGPAKTGLYPHPMFGKFTSVQWGQAMYKHLDHHLQQFGV
ncbi:MAG: DUF1569 domain-containing protein [Ferruginibacter sp.]